jgi:hypothetical protein
MGNRASSIKEDNIHAKPTDKRIAHARKQAERDACADIFDMDAFQAFQTHTVSWVRTNFSTREKWQALRWNSVHDDQTRISLGMAAMAFVSTYADVLGTIDRECLLQLNMQQRDATGRTVLHHFAQSSNVADCYNNNYVKCWRMLLGLAGRVDMMDMQGTTCLAQGPPYGANGEEWVDAVMTLTTWNLNDPVCTVSGDTLIHRLGKNPVLMVQTCIKYRDQIDWFACNKAGVTYRSILQKHTHELKKFNIYAAAWMKHQFPLMREFIQDALPVNDLANLAASYLVGDKDKKTSGDTENDNLSDNGLAQGVIVRRWFKDEQTQVPRSDVVLLFHNYQDHPKVGALYWTVMATGAVSTQDHDYTRNPAQCMPLRAIQNVRLGRPAVMDQSTAANAKMCISMSSDAPNTPTLYIETATLECREYIVNSIKKAYDRRKKRVVNVVVKHAD